MHERTTPEALLLSGDWGTLGISPAGATVTSWAPGGNEQVFTARDAAPTYGEMWHGGIPLCAPWFGRGTAFEWDPPHVHGLVSRVVWGVAETTSSDVGATVVLVTDGGAAGHLPGAEHFPADLAYRLTIEADALSLHLALEITSPTTPARVEAVFHPYLVVDAPSAQLSGLGGLPFHDYSCETDGIETDSISIESCLDRVYAGTAPVTIRDAGGRLDVVPEAAATTVLWNPGPDDPDFREGEWQRFVCLEFGNAESAAIDLPAGGTHTVGIKLTLH